MQVMGKHGLSKVQRLTQAFNVVGTELPHWSKKQADKSRRIHASSPC